MLLLAPLKTDPFGTNPVIRGITTAFEPAGLPVEPVIDALIDRAFEVSGSVKAPSFVVVAGNGGGTAQILERINTRWPCESPKVLDVARVLGDTGAASASFALAVCIEAIQRRTLGGEEGGWVLAADPSGYLGIAVVSRS